LILPPGFTLVTTGLNVGAHTPEEFDKAIENLTSALSVFVAEEVEALLLGGITIATRRGFRGEREIVSALLRRLAIPIASALSANADALKHLGAERIVVATAYKDEILQKLRRYFEDAGFKVCGISGLNVARPVDQVKLPEEASYRAALGLFRDHPEADAVLIHGRWRSVAHVEKLEKDTGRPVVASTAASLWWAIKTLGMKVPIQGFGQLLR